MNLRGSMRDDYRKRQSELVAMCEALDAHIERLPDLVYEIQQMIKRINYLEVRGRGLGGVSGVKLSTPMYIPQIVRARLAHMVRLGFEGSDVSAVRAQVDASLALADVARADGQVMEETFRHFDERGI